jgi:hypothetical protein
VAEYELVEQGTVHMNDYLFAAGCVIGFVVLIAVLKALTDE